jgi:cbb3-type cytochrome oxidase maturation protein
MDLIFVVVPIALALGAFFVVAFLWSVKSGQLDDLDSPAVRMLHDDEPESAPRDEPGA